MSYIFEVADETIWSPARRVGQLYVGYIESIARTLKLPTGLTAVANDYFEINLAQFKSLIDTAANEYVTSSHTIFYQLLEPVLPVSIALILRADPTWQVANPGAQDLVNAAYPLSRDMPQ
ncbi:hypothetical protein GCM10022224_089590 [Nonomuraea antimicrobica]|uniref:Uncharacterized protein n=1 Tax=Nonomuraea antimicrobica TaxID=561173 RepID=A0ABP7DVJ3_9ACTN